ncbi:MAG: FtsW/RodA/SpoVE family cell cycle protein [Alphaproteobacteria bacterium]
MSRAFARTDNSILGNWWWTIDKWIFTSIFILIGIGILLNFAASPAVANTINVNMYHFIKKQLFLMPVAVLIIITLSLQSPKYIRYFSIGAFCFFMLLVMLTPFLGTEIKGATRWISLFGFSIQPSEFLKPLFVVVSASLFALPDNGKRINSHMIATFLFLFVISFLVIQPDIGMSLVISTVWATQFFIAGLPIIWVVALACCGVVGIITAYFTLQHVQLRIDRFLHPEGGLSYQVRRSLEAFSDGGLFGVGPGEGKVKFHLPDAHTDFIFAVAGEEFGLIFCLCIVTLFAIVVIKSFNLIMKEKDMFIILAVTGLAVQFGLQALINMASSLHLMPTKGMTLPFISYGGSSLISSSIGIGMLLGVTRKRIVQGTN